MELVKKGMSRHDAYSLIQSAAIKAWDSEGSFKENIMSESKILSFLSRDELERLFDVKYHLRYIDKIINRLADI